MALTERPTNGAATAIWSPERNEFRRCPPVNGEDDGEARLNRPDGTLACVVPYEQGKSNERFTPFLQNRRPSKTDTKAGKEDGRLTWYRPAPSAETTATTLPDACATSVVEMRAEFVDGVAGPVEFYDTSGAEVGPVTAEVGPVTAKPIPKRPEGVSSRCRDAEQWPRCSRLLSAAVVGGPHVTYAALALAKLGTDEARDSR